MNTLECKRCEHKQCKVYLGKTRYIPAKCPHSTFHVICENCNEVFTIKRNRSGNTRILMCCSPHCINSISKGRREQTTLKRYGVKNAAQSDTIKAKIKQVNLDRYGTESPGNTKEARDKARKTWMEKYGVDNPNKCKEIREKSQDTCLKRYGVRCTLEKGSIVRDKINRTNLLRYGTLDPGNRPEAQAKRRQTNKLRYGHEYYSQTDQYKQQVKDTCLRKYGKEYYTQTEDILKKIKATSMAKYGVPSPSMSPEVKKRISETVKSKYGKNWFVETDKFKESFHGRISKRNLLVEDTLQSYNVKNMMEYQVGELYYDFYLCDLNILLEVDPTVSHTTERKARPCNVSMYNQINRTTNAHNYGYNCIHVFDWDDIDYVCKYFSHTCNSYKYIGVSNTLQCNNSIDFFTIDDMHTYDCVFNVYTDETCIADITVKYLSDKRANIQNILSRYSLTPSVLEDILRYVMNTLTDVNTFEMCVDYSKMYVRGFTNLRFKKVLSEPNKYWSRGTDVRTDSHVQKFGYSDMIKLKEPTILDTEEKTLSTIGWFPVYDCGNAKYVFTREG